MPNVSLNNAGQSVGGVSVSSLTISSFVVGAGADGCIYLGVSQWKSVGDLAPTAVFNGNQSFTVHDYVSLDTGAGGFRRVTILKLVNPAVATGSIVISWAGGINEAVCGATAWNNVDQVTPFDTAVKASAGTGTSSSISIPNNLGDVVHDALASNGSPTSTPTATGNQTARWRLVVVNSTDGSGQSAAGTGSNITCSWSSFIDGTYCHIGAAIKQSSGNVPLQYNRTRPAVNQRMAA